MKISFASLFICCLCSFPSLIFAQDFYALETIQTIEITFAESNWDQLLDNEKATTEEYILAQSVTINGEVFDSVGVKYKGNSTYQPNQTKNPFHIELDTYKDHEYDGYTDIKLSNVAKDPSFLREVLSYQVLRQYMDAPLSNYANVYVNGDLIGLYTNSEAVSKKFVKRRFGSKSNTFVKCNPPAGAGPQANDFPNLVHLGQDSSQYYDAYEIKSDHGWADLIDLCDQLENNFDNIEQTLDIDRAIWMLAFNNALVNLDSYSGGFTQNYYLYKNDEGQFVSVVWDLNESFGRFSNSGAGNLNNTNSKINMDPFLHENDSDFPLIQKILSNDRYRKMYIAHMKTMLEENFQNGAYISEAESYRMLIDSDVQADDNKLFSYNNFLDNLDNDVSSGGGPGGGGGGPGGGATPGIIPLMDGRSDYILGLSSFNHEAPEISEISFSTDSPIVDEDITVIATLDNANFAYIGYRNNEFSSFTKVEMIENGSGQFEATMPVNDIFTQYYIYSENSLAGIFSPLRAEHEFHTLLATSSNTATGDLVINEFMASNDETVADQDEEYDDWIELYNNSDIEIDLTGYTLSDNIEEPAKWMFPDGTSIQAGNYLIIWADDDEEQEGLHSSFKLSSSGESLLLSDADGNRIDEVTYAEQTTDVSYGRFPNGIGDFQSMISTFDATNSGLSDASEIDLKPAMINIYPNPTEANNITISLETASQLYGSIYNMDGRLMMNFDIQSVLEIDISEWSTGVYIVKIGDSYTRFTKI